MEKQLLQDCQSRISPYIHRTPVLTSQLINAISDVDLYFKCENFQKMGAFKMRGSTNAIMQLTEEQKSKGVVTHSSGNFGQALALAARNQGVKAYIVMPENAPKVKKVAVKGYGGIVSECESTLAEREHTSSQIIKTKGATFIHPSNDINVIIGNSTAAMELLEVHSDLNYVCSPIGGGGLIAGTALAVHFFGDQCKVIGGEPAEADDAYRSFKSGKIEINSSTNTVADGLRTHLGSINFPIIQKHVERIILVTESEILASLRLIWERLKIVVEPSSAVALAAILKEKEAFKGQKIGIILSGGNVDLSQLPF